MFDQIKDFVLKNKVTSAVVAAVAAVGLYAANDQSANSGGGGGDGGFGVQSGARGGGRHEVIDQHGFAQPVVALTLPVPSGWRAQSEVRWNNLSGQCSAVVASPYVRLQSGDGREQIEFLPGYIVTTDSSSITNRGTAPGDFCVVAMAPTGESLVRQIMVPRLRPGARVDRINVIPLTPAQQNARAQMEQTSRVAGHSHMEVYSLEAWLTHQDGTIEIIAVSGYAFGYPQLIAGVPPITFNSTEGEISVRAATADRAAALMQQARQIVEQVQFNPEWQSQVQETQRAVSRPVIASRGGGGGGVRGGGGGGGGGVDMDAWREEQRREDRRQRERIDTIREVERCYDPETGRTYEVSIHVGC